MYGMINSLQAAKQWKNKDKEPDQIKRRIHFFFRPVWSNYKMEWLQFAAKQIVFHWKNNENKYFVIFYYGTGQY